MRVALVIAAIAVIGTAAIVGGLTWWGGAGDEEAAQAEQALSWIDPVLARDYPQLLLKGVLEQFHRAFDRPDDESARRALAAICAPAVLETQLARRTDERSSGPPSGVLHNIEMIGFDMAEADGAFTFDARWRIVRKIGEQTHRHVSGAVLSARLTVDHVEGAWRIMALDISDIDRSEAGRDFQPSVPD